jgi:uncharacterized protein (TIGR03437 family)
MRLLATALLLALAASGQEFPQGVDLIQRIDNLYPWLNVLAFDVDELGNTYLAGSVQGPIPAAIAIRIGPLGGNDIVVVKTDAAGRQIYGTAIGGSQDEFVGRIKVDPLGNLYLVGSTNSQDYPAMSPQVAGTAMVALKLDATGNIIYNSRITSPGTVLTMNLDMAGDLYIGGIPNPSGAAGFIAKLDTTGNSAAATYTEAQVSNVIIRQNGDVLFSMGKTIAALDGALSRWLFSTLTDVDTNIANLGVDSANNIYVAVPDAVRKFAPDGGQLLWARNFAPASFPQFAMTPSGTAFLFGGAPPNYPNLNGTQACGTELSVPVSGVAVPAGTYGFLTAIGPEGDTQYATFMAEEIPRFLPIMVSADGRAYALSEAFLTLDGRPSRWQGIVRFDPGHLASPHTSAGCLVHSATLQVSPIAPGTIMTLFGEQMGPAIGTSFVLQDGHVPFNIAGASVTVDGKSAPVLYAQAGQINFIAPWSLRTDGTRVPICVQMNAANSCLSAPTALIAPGLFVVNSQIAAINPDGTINSPQHPAPSGSYVSVYMTGGGQIQAPMVDGKVAGFELQRISAADAAVFTAFLCEPFGGCNNIPLGAHPV